MLEAAASEAAAPRAGRRLEVVVLGARSLPGEGRRKAHITLVSRRDPAGDAFGAKVSPWTEGAGGRASGWRLRFGQRGLRCSFPLDTSQGAPALAADVRFADATQLRVRLLVSSLPSQNAVFRAATKLLPASLADGVSHELDEVTAEVEAEALIPLANILSGRAGFAADRALGGWVPLRLLLPRAEGAPQGEEPPLSLWMQMYALPDHEAILPQLRTQLEEELSRGAGRSAAADGGICWSGLGEAAEAEAPAPGRARPKPAPRWGPAVRDAPAEAAASAVAAPDLIDVSLDDGPELLGPEVSSRPGGGGGGGPDLLDDQAGLPRLGLGAADLLGGESPSARGPADLDLLGRDGTPAEQIGGSLPSAFGFISAGSPGEARQAGASLGSPAPGPSGAHAAGVAGAGAAAGGDGSAFGFIAAGSPSAQLDLAALYGGTGATAPGGAPPPLPGQSLSSTWNAKFAPLVGLDQAAARKGAGHGGDPFASLAADALSGLR